MRRLAEGLCRNHFAGRTWQNMEENMTWCMKMSRTKESKHKLATMSCCMLGFRSENPKSDSGDNGKVRTGFKKHKQKSSHGNYKIKSHPKLLPTLTVGGIPQSCLLLVIYIYVCITIIPRPFFPSCQILAL